MRERGHHLELVCQPPAQLVGRLRGEGFTVHTVPMKVNINFVKGVGKIRTILRDGKFAVLHTHRRNKTLVAGLADRLAAIPHNVRTLPMATKPGYLSLFSWVSHRIPT